MIDSVDRSSLFWPKVDKTETCWLWTGARSTAGYGRFRITGGYSQAHRWAYEQLVGPIPDGLQLDHLCRTPACVNPAHLEPVTQAENLRRGLVNQHKGKTHCVNGHELTPGNFSITGRGARRCLQCHREQSAALRRRIANRAQLERFKAGETRVSA